jgi:hypothetical protein
VLKILTDYMKLHTAIKVQLDVEFVVRDIKNEEDTIFPTRTRQYEILTADDDNLKVSLVQMIEETKMSFENKDLKKWGLILKKINKMTLHYAKYVPLKAGLFIELPACIANAKSCINIKNDDDLCFKYSFICMVHKVHEGSSGEGE